MNAYLPENGQTDHWDEWNRIFSGAPPRRDERYRDEGADNKSRAQDGEPAFRSPNTSYQPQELDIAQTEARSFADEMQGDSRTTQEHCGKHI